MQCDRPLVFVVDDDRAVRNSLKFALETEGLEVQACDSGPSLLAHARLSDASCLLIDYQMPVMDGFEIVAELLRRGLHVPVILMTGMITAELRRLADASGLPHIVEKPLMDGALIETLQTVLLSACKLAAH